MKNEGKYIEGDYVVSLKKEQQFLLEYNHKIKNIKASERNIFHIDIPFRYFPYPMRTKRLSLSTSW